MGKLLSNSGGYRKLLSYNKAEAIYDITYIFCTKFLKKGDRTIDQMIQAARSGKQNIAEASVAAATSTETELKLTNVAKASLHELLIDYEDYLRTRNLPKWDKESAEVAKVRELGKKHNESQFYVKLIENHSDTTVANIAIVLIHQADYLLTKQLAYLEKQFLSNGGFREKMYKQRISIRESENQ